MNTENSAGLDQKQGIINKCPSCGGALKAFAANCHLCGHELAGVGPNRTIAALADKFDAIEAEASQAGLQGAAREKEVCARKARVIRDFPIPNSRDDLLSLIHFIRPKIEDNIKPDPNLEDWRVKFKEVLTLAKNAYRGDAKTRAEFEEIEQSLKVTLGGALQSRARRSPLVVIGVGVVILLVMGGFGVAQYGQWKQGQCEKAFAQGAQAETARLTEISGAAESAIKDRQLPQARARLDQLQWQYQEACLPAAGEAEKIRWEAARQTLLGKIQAIEADEQARAQEAQRQEQAKMQEAERLEQARQQAEIDRELAEKRAKAAQEMRKNREKVDQEMEEGLTSRARAAAARKER